MVIMTVAIKKMSVAVVCVTDNAKSFLSGFCFDIVPHTVIDRWTLSVIKPVASFSQWGSGLLKRLFWVKMMIVCPQNPLGMCLELISFVFMSLTVADR
jgi:hypothetical protein